MISVFPTIFFYYYYYKKAQFYRDLELFTQVVAVRNVKFLLGYSKMYLFVSVEIRA